VTAQERVQAIADYGFTERQARFLMLVMRHAGLCIKRQYGVFAGVARGGEKRNVFFEKPAFNWLQPAEPSQVSLVDQTGASWNRLTSWLRQIDAVMRAA
jgi:hypothetical protein